MQWGEQKGKNSATGMGHAKSLESGYKLAKLMAETLARVWVVKWERYTSKSGVGTEVG